MKNQRTTLESLDHGRVDDRYRESARKWMQKLHCKSLSDESSKTRPPSFPSLSVSDAMHVQSVACTAFDEVSTRVDLIQVHHFRWHWNYYCGSMSVSVKMFMWRIFCAKWTRASLRNAWLDIVSKGIVLSSWDEWNDDDGFRRMKSSALQNVTFRTDHETWIKRARMISKEKDLKITLDLIFIICNPATGICRVISGYHVSVYV